MNRSNRREFVASISASVGGLLLPVTSGTNPAAARMMPSRTRVNRPNVVLIICDDIGYGDPRCYGSSLKTPNLDQLAAEGVRFTHFNSAHPICSASRAALLTGRYAPRSGTKPVYFPGDADGLGLEEKTIANCLHDAGYRSMCVGKWHLGDTREYLPTSRGFDSYFGVPYSVDMKPLPMIKDLEVLEENADRATLTPRYTKAALDFIETPSTSPFFLYVAHSYPHIPINASPRFKGKSKHGIYGDAVEEIDWSVGEILSSLDRHNRRNQTLVIFTGDHGPWFQGSPGPSRGRKATTYEGGFRVPFIASLPGMLPAGSVVSEFASSLDVFPSLLAMCGAKAGPLPLDGADLSSLLTGEGNARNGDTVLYFAGMQGGQHAQCARRGNWKVRFAQFATETYILSPADAGPNFLLAYPELYDLEHDPGESYDVATEHPEIVQQILADVDRLIATFPSATRSAYAKLQENRANPTTPSAAAARPPSYHPAPTHFDPEDKS